MGITLAIGAVIISMEDGPLWLTLLTLSIAFIFGVIERA